MWRQLESEAEHWSFIRAAKFTPGIFLQSPAWAKYQESLGNTVKSLGWYEDSKLTGVASLSWQQLPLGFGYWLCPKGPVWDADISESKKNQGLIELYKYLKDSKAFLLRFEPAQKPLEATVTKDINPRATSVVDLTKNWDEILTGMHEKTRYNLRLAERKGLKFRWGSVADFDNFWQLLQSTAKREGFRTHAANHYKKLLELFGSESLDTTAIACRLGLVEFNEQLLAVSLVLVCNREATYLHGASSREHHELMAPYLLHGEAMHQLQQAGCKSYDFWGVQPKDGALKSWAGFSRFKLGWGGQYFEEPGTFDYPIKKFIYLVYRLARNLLK